MERIALGTLAVLVLAQGAYTLTLQRNLRALGERLDQAPLVESTAAPPAVHTRPEAVIPRLTPATAVAPLPPLLEALGTVEARRKIQEVMGTIKEEKRREKMMKSVDRREKIDQRVKELIGPELALTADENARAAEILARAITTRRHAIEELQSGARSRTEAKLEIDGAGKTADQALEKLLGERRLSGYKELRKKAASADVSTAAPKP